eukprot:PLAT8661.2.p2 GENE.PLAT8661.2~~PLAT8661.2.p2  ORF type:complete len:241 (-),score=116.57 PLAT8661.2:159-881(-)
MKLHDDWQVLLVDHRGHGDSVGGSEPHTLAAAAADVEALLEERELEADVIVGHSFGGRVALEMAAQRRRDSLPLPHQLWALDIAPQATKALGVADVLRAVLQAKVPVASRAELVEQLTNAGCSLMLAQWMTTNLKPVDAAAPAGPLTWKLNLPVVRDLLSDLQDGGVTAWPLLETAGDSPDCTFHIVQAERSDIWTDDVLSRLRACPSNVQLHEMAGVGHWLHSEDPHGLMKLMRGAWEW